MEENQLRDRVTLYLGPIESSYFDHKVDIIVSMPFGYSLYFGNTLETLCYVRDNYLKKGGFEKDGKTIRYGIFKKHLKQELSTSPMAYAELKRSRNNNLVVVGCTLASAILTVSGTQRIFVKKELNYSGLCFNLLSIPFKIKSKNHINRAVWLYNRDVMSKK